MKHLFVARHGSYGFDNRLNDHGRQQMEVLGKVIKGILKDNSAYLISSTAPRALDSSRILIAQLGLSEFEQVPYLWTGPDSSEVLYRREPNLNKLMELVNERKEKVDGLIMVTHLEVAEDFPSYFLKKEFEQDEYIGMISKGQAVHLDLGKKACQILPR